MVPISRLNWQYRMMLVGCRNKQSERPDITCACCDTAALCKCPSVVLQPLQRSCRTLLAIISAAIELLQSFLRCGGGLQAKPPTILYEEPNNQICSMDVEASTGRDIMCATDQECLVYLSHQ